MKIFIEIDEKYLGAVKKVLSAADEEQKNVSSKETRTEERIVKKAAASAEQENQTDYESMSSKDLYKLCCERGISSQCKKRDKASLIKVLRENEAGATEQESEDTEFEDWEDDEKKNDEKDPYVGKNARELYSLCMERGLSVPKRLKPEEYVKKLKAADAEAGNSESDDEEDWEI